MGDTLIDNNLTELVDNVKNCVLTSQEFGETRNWCVITKKDSIIDEIFDKKELHKDEKYHALVGCYFFSDTDLLKNVLDKFADDEKLEIRSFRKLFFYKTICS